MNIVVLGGSFNPPTIAHLKTLQKAMDIVGAEKGIFVPSPHAYVRKKMARAGHTEETLPEKIRFQMLDKMAKEDGRLSVSDIEYHRTEKSYTYETLVALQEAYPDDTLYFLAGGDKISIFPRWHRIKEFLERFHIIVIKRDDEDAATEIANHPFLRNYQHMFRVLEPLEEYESISSSAVRACLREGKVGAERMLHPEVLKLLQDYRLNPKGENDWIDCFRGEYHFLSNFYEAPVEYGGFRYLNNEAAFQAQKCLSDEERQAFFFVSAARAKSMGRRVLLRADWESVKVGLMEDIVRAKFTQNPELAALLLATGDKKLLEGNTWHDTFWGVESDTHQGENHLGKILMKIREELR